MEVNLFQYKTISINNVQNTIRACGSLGIYL